MYSKHLYFIVNVYALRLYTRTMHHITNQQGLNLGARVQEDGSCMLSLKIISYPLQQFSKERVEALITGISGDHR